MLNSFSDEIRQLFQFENRCFSCGKNCDITLHHVVTRGGNKHSDCESSALNACPLCASCHSDDYRTDHGFPPLSSSSARRKLLKTIYDFLKSKHYHLNEKDGRFIKKYHQYL